MKFGGLILYIKFGSLYGLAVLYDM